LDNNTQLSKKAAMRVVGSWENGSGQRNFEFNKTNSLTANLSLIPFDSGKVKLTAEIEAYDSKFNVNSNDWIQPDGWFQAYANPSQALITAAGTAVSRRRRSGCGLPQSYLRQPRRLHCRRPQRRQRSGHPALHPCGGRCLLHRSQRQTHSRPRLQLRQPRLLLPEQHVDTATFTVEAAPTSWMDARYVLTK